MQQSDFNATSLPLDDISTSDLAEYLTQRLMGSRSHPLTKRLDDLQSWQVAELIGTRLASKQSQDEDSPTDYVRFPADLIGPALDILDVYEHDREPEDQVATADERQAIRDALNAHALKQAKGRIEELLAEAAMRIDRIGGAYYADDVAEMFNEIAKGRLPAFMNRHPG